VKTAETRGKVGVEAHYLDNTANYVGQDSPKSSNYRQARWAMRSVLWDITTLPRVASCGRWAVTASGFVDVRKKQVAGYAGLATCGSVHVCPVCNSKVMATRRLEVGVMISAFPSAAFGAYTLRHTASDSLKDLLTARTKLWQRVAQSRPVRECRKDLGVSGIIRGSEITYGQHGWHPHIHPVFVFDREISPAYVQQLHAVQQTAWITAAHNLGLSAPATAAQQLGLVYDSADINRYLTKTTFNGTHSVSWEVTSSQTKSSVRTGGRTQWEILDGVRHGCADSLDLWREYEQATKGTRVLTVSPGLRKKAGLDMEQSDEELAAMEVGTEADTGFTILDWAPFRENPGWGADLLTVVEQHGFPAGIQWCLDRGIPVEDPDPIGKRSSLRVGEEK